MKVDFGCKKFIEVYYSLYLNISDEKVALNVGRFNEESYGWLCAPLQLLPVVEFLFEKRCLRRSIKLGDDFIRKPKL